MAIKIRAAAGLENYATRARILSKNTVLHGLRDERRSALI
jgi:hypothetical protein